MPPLAPSSAEERAWFAERQAVADARKAQRAAAAARGGGAEGELGALCSADKPAGCQRVPSADAYACWLLLCGHSQRPACSPLPPPVAPVPADVEARLRELVAAACVVRDMPSLASPHDMLMAQVPGGCRGWCVVHMYLSWRALRPGPSAALLALRCCPHPACVCFAATTAPPRRRGPVSRRPPQTRLENTFTCQPQQRNPHGAHARTHAAAAACAPGRCCGGKAACRAGTGR